MFPDHFSPHHAIGIPGRVARFLEKARWGDSEFSYAMPDYGRIWKNVSGVHSFWIAEGPQVLASLIVVLKERKKGRPPMIYQTGLWVLPKLRGQGLGKALVGSARQFFRKQAPIFYTHLADDNRASHRIFESFGDREIVRFCTVTLRTLTPSTVRGVKVTRLPLCGSSEWRLGADKLRARLRHFDIQKRGTSSKRFQLVKLGQIEMTSPTKWFQLLGSVLRHHRVQVANLYLKAGDPLLKRLRKGARGWSLDVSRGLAFYASRRLRKDAAELSLLDE